MFSDDTARYASLYQTLCVHDGRGDRSSSSGPHRPVVVGVDGSAPSLHAVEWTADLAKDLGAEVIVVHALPFGDQVARDAITLGLASWRRQLQETVTGPWCGGLQDAGIAHCVVLAQRPVVAALIGVAQRDKASRIVIGIHTHRAHRLVGSVSSALAHHAPCPVVTVPEQPTELTALA